MSRFDSSLAVAGSAAQEERAMQKLSQANPAWSFGFQCNERYLEWDSSAQARLLKLHCAEKLGWPVQQVLPTTCACMRQLRARWHHCLAVMRKAWTTLTVHMQTTWLPWHSLLPQGNACAQVEEELGELLDILPDLTVRLDRIKASLLLKLLQSKDRVAGNLVALRKCLPGLNASNVMLRYPALLTDVDGAEIEAQVQVLRCVLTSSAGLASACAKHRCQAIDRS
jgi:hypothetical protein